MTDHETTLRTLADIWALRARLGDRQHSEEHAACLAGAEALRLLPAALAGDLCRDGHCSHPDCVSVRALVAPTETTTS